MTTEFGGSVPGGSTSGEPGEPGPTDESERRKRTEGSAAAARVEHKASWVDQQIRVAMARGDFDDLPGAGKPITDLGSDHDPNWWLKKLIEREQISGVLPPALQLRKDDAELEAVLDSHHVVSEVRREVEDFNARVMRARYTPVDGPPLVTMPRDVEVEAEAWAARRAARSSARRALVAGEDEDTTGSLAARRRGWFRRGQPRRGMRHTDR